MTGVAGIQKVCEHARSHRLPARKPRQLENVHRPAGGAHSAEVVGEEREPRRTSLRGLIAGHHTPKSSREGDSPPLSRHDRPQEDPAELAARLRIRITRLRSRKSPSAVHEELEWQIASMRSDVAAALRSLPPVCSDSTGPRGPGLLSSGQLGDRNRLLQARFAVYCEHGVCDRPVTSHTATSRSHPADSGCAHRLDESDSRKPAQSSTRRQPQE